MSGRCRHGGNDDQPLDRRVVIVILLCLGVAALGGFLQTEGGGPGRVTVVERAIDQLRSQPLAGVAVRTHDGWVVQQVTTASSEWNCDANDTAGCQSWVDQTCADVGDTGESYGDADVESNEDANGVTHITCSGHCPSGTRIAFKTCTQVIDDPEPVDQDADGGDRDLEPA